MTVKDNKITEIDALFPSNSEATRLLIGCSKDHYSASRIAHAVEDCDAHLLNLNVTCYGGAAPDEADAFGGNELVIDIRVDRRNPAAVIRSLERYGYEVLGYDDKHLMDDDTIRDRYREFMHYLSI
ncbi:MAG: hypothetical protein ACI306_05230 [Muribaculaceae bacterium]